MAIHTVPIHRGLIKELLPADPSEQQGQQFSKTSVRSDELIKSVVSRPSEISRQDLITEHDSICQLKEVCVSSDTLAFCLHR